jgi:hypothetical protein
VTKKTLHLHQDFRHHALELRIIRRDFERRIDQHAAAAARVLHRSVNDFLEEGADGLARGQGLEPADAIREAELHIAVERAAIERTLVPEGVVKARIGDPHAGREIAHRRRLVAALPEALDGRAKRGFLIELSGPGHAESRSRAGTPRF